MKRDKQVFDLINKEKHRQDTNIELIASENFVSEQVLKATGSILTNKYAEGYPGKRYYGGCEFVDEIEQLAIDRAKQLFNAEYANVQPHSGSQANAAVYAAFLEPGDVVLGMSLTHMGHLTHGSPVNFSGKLYNFYHYGVNRETERIDYKEVRQIAQQVKPKMLVAGASAYPREIDFEKLASIAKEVGAIFFVDMAHIAGLVAAGLHQSPVLYADVVSTTTHKTLRGPRGGIILAKQKHAKKLNSAVFPFGQGGPLEHIIAAKAVALGEALEPDFIDYQKQVLKNSQALAKRLVELGVKLVSGGTDNHLMLLNLRDTGVTGKELQQRLDSVGITTNKNTIPFEELSPMVTSGLRIGTPAVTTKGLTEKHMKLIADIIYAAIYNFDERMLKKKVEEIVKNYS